MIKHIVIVIFSLILSFFFSIFIAPEAFFSEEIVYFYNQAQLDKAIEIVKEYPKGLAEKEIGKYEKHKKEITDFLNTPNPTKEEIQKFFNVLKSVDNQNKFEYRWSPSFKKLWLSQNWTLAVLVFCLTLLIIQGFYWLIYYILIKWPETTTGLKEEYQKLITKNGTVYVPIDIVTKDCENIRKKLSSPIQTFWNSQIADVLENLFIKGSKGKVEFNEISSGMVWVLKEADFHFYTEIATHFDEAVLKGVSSGSEGYIHSTNTLMPSDCSSPKATTQRVIKDHIERVNQLINSKKGELPSLLRLQLLHGEKKESIIPELIKFTSDLEKNEAHTYKELYYQPNCTFFIDVDKIPLAKGIPFEISHYFLGDYILYSDMVVLKWDKQCNVLYLMFGKEIIDAYKEIFRKFMENWKNDPEIHISHGENVKNPNNTPWQNVNSLWGLLTKSHL